MTALLDKIRQLEAARNRGDISAAEFERAKARLFDGVEDAVTAPPVRSAAPRPAAKSNAGMLWSVLTFGALALGVITGLAVLITDDLTMAFTIALTLFAALTILAYRALDR